MNKHAHMFSMFPINVLTLHGQKYVGTWPSLPFAGLSRTFVTKVECTQVSRMSLDSVVLRFPFTGTKRPKHGPVWQCPWTKHMVYQGWSRTTWVACTEPWPSASLIAFGMNWNVSYCPVWENGQMGTNHTSLVPKSTGRHSQSNSKGIWPDKFNKHIWMWCSCVHILLHIVCRSVLPYMPNGVV